MKKLTIIIITFNILFNCDGTNMKNKNRLSNSHSPYLLQHSTNPVDWYPWSIEAFDRAKKENKPIFLSIGYATCHWCHVMEHESFEDSSVAQIMNEKFINIKVDREEMPEVDHLYMSVCQAMTGRGGWPLTIVMTPEKEPFFAGTYFPKDSQGKRPGMLQLLPSLANAWVGKQDEIQKSIDKVKNYLIEINTSEPGDYWDEKIITDSFSGFASRFDPDYGGFGKAPKFPSPHNLIFLLRFSHYYEDISALKMVNTSLRYMRQGGIFDHIGLGFHRYSTDKQWFLPHFEKMLYDQAMHSIAYLEAYQKTKNEEYASVAREIFDYVSRDMTNSEGGFFSAEDADSEGEEGTFYIWSKEEVLKILGELDGSKFSKIYGFEKNGNFYDEATGQSNGKNIPYLSRSITDLSKKYGIKEPELKKLLKTSRKKLFEVRKKRIHPLKDDKILTDWNGLMIAAYALGGQILNDTSLINTAKRSFDFIENNLIKENGRLLKRYRLGDSGLSPHIDDYAFTIWGLLNLYDATFEIEYLSKAIKLTKVMIQEFSDQNGGFFIGGINSEKLMIRAKDSYDGAIPSGNSVAVNNLFRLSKLTGDLTFDSISKSTLRAFTDQAKHAPSGFAHMITGFMFNIKDPIQLVIVADCKKHDLSQVFEKINLKYSPNKVVLLKDISKPAELEEIAPWVKNYKMMDNKPTYYLCEDFVCKRPTTNLNTILKIIDKH
mgnify:FL=1